MLPTNCLNCTQPLVPGIKYCANCGQKAVTHRLSVRDIYHDIIHYFTHADKNIFHLIRQLAVRPGKVAAEYLAGRRQYYFKPLNFFLIVAAILVFMTGLFYHADNARIRSLESAAVKQTNPERKAGMLAMAGRMKKVNEITGKYSNVINMLATPFLALLFWLFYRKRFNYAEALVANMYFIGFIMLFYSLVIVPLRAWIPTGGYYLLGSFFLFEVVYRGIAFQQMTKTRGAWPGVKAYLVSFLMSAVWIAITYSLISYYIRKGF